MPREVASAAARLRHVFVRDLELNALLGIYPEERTTPQRILVNVDLSVKEGDDPLSEDIASVVSYEVVVREVERIVAQGHVNLVETLAELIARECLKDARVETVRIRIEKPDVIRNARSVGVEIERTR
ncbi:MAG: dihydroneopterin aldolase [Hyphomicrobiales bacterium]